MELSFVRRIKGKKDRLSITVPREIIRQYGLEPKDYFMVTLEGEKTRTPPLVVQFRKLLSKCGEEGILIYIPKKVVVENSLERDMAVTVTLEDA